MDLLQRELTEQDSKIWPEYRTRVAYRMQKVAFGVQSLKRGKTGPSYY